MLVDYDILVSTSDCPEIDMPADKLFLTARSPVLRSLFVEGPQSVGVVGHFIPSTIPGEKARIVFIQRRQITNTSDSFVLHLH